MNISEPSDHLAGERTESSSCIAAWMKRRGLALLTDWYELTMMGGYHQSGTGAKRACFEYLFRELPPHNGYAILAGLEAFLDYYEALRFEEDDISYLRSTDAFDESFLRSLRDFRPSCDIWAMPEGSVIFPFEPLMRIEGPLFEAQLLETFLLNALNYPTLVATKAARICQVAAPDPVIEFGLRRAQGPDGSLQGARAAYIGGCQGTSNVLAGKFFGIPVRGTHAHSWVMSFPDELEAFRAYVKIYPQGPILLVDTYDTLASGIPNAIRVFQEMRDSGQAQRVAIRLDSGDLARLSKAAFQMIKAAGFDDPLIVASNELDEDLIADLKRQGARVNSWGVGTKLITAGESPALTGIYKLAALQEGGVWQSKLKVSSNPRKATDPGLKRVVRFYDADSRPIADVMHLDEEAEVAGSEVQGVDRQQLHSRRHFRAVVRRESLLQPCVKEGKRIVAPEALQAIRGRAREQIAALPDELKRLRNPEIYPVLLSPQLAKLKEDMLKP